MTPRSPGTVKGIRRLLDKFAESFIQTVRRLEPSATGARLFARLELDSDFTYNAAGEIEFDLRAKSNIPTEPIAGEIGAGMTRAHRRAGDGQIRIVFVITATIAPTSADVN